jgi:tetratricopeptide (TPR) repeat protein
MRIVAAIIAFGLWPALWCGSQAVGPPSDDPLVNQARKARDRADTGALSAAIATAQQQASQKNSLDAYLRLAVFEDWLFEAASDHQDKGLAKQAAQGGVAAAEKAVQLNPNSSEAHRLLGNSLGECIPYVFAGGMRYGPRSTREDDKAIELDPKNANAYITRANAYFYTPETFGGNKQKAVELLKHAIEIDPTSDTAHISLAQDYLATGRRDDALREINEAKRLNPDRIFAKSVYGQITSKK